MTGAASRAVASAANAPVRDERRAGLARDRQLPAAHQVRDGVDAPDPGLTDADHDAFVAAVDDYCGAYKNVLADF